MSHSRNDTSDRRADATRPYFELSQMMKQGRSWSGRERNCCFLNTGAERFADISATSGLDFPDDARAVAVVDWDHDGDLDLWISNRGAPRLRFMRSETRSAAPAPAGTRFLAGRLVGDGTSTNRDAIGARVDVYTDGTGARGPKSARTLRAGEGFLSQSSKWLHFGLGTAERIERVVVRWPSRAPGGHIQEFRGLEVDHRYELRQGEPDAVAWTPAARAVKLRPSTPAAPPASGQARIPLVTLLDLPDLGPGFPAILPGSGLRGQPAPAFGKGRSVLINLWASWCAPCVAELKEFTEKAAELRARGVEVVALAVDGVGTDQSNPRRAASVISKLDFPFSSGAATPRLLRVLQHLHDSLLALHRPLPLPTSFLVDPAGRVAVIYKGRVPVETILGDLEHSGLPAIDRWRRSAPLPGIAIEHERVRDTATTAEVKARFQFAADLSLAGLVEDAAKHYRAVLELKPDFAEARNNLGLACVGQGKLIEAAAEYERVIAERPDFAEAHHNLGIVHERQGDLAGAAARYEQAIRLKPDYAGASNALGVVYARQGRMPDAAAMFEQEIRINPSFAEAHNNLGRIFLAAGRTTEARERFERAIELEPGFAEAFNNLGITLKREERLEEAATAYLQAIRLHPGFAQVHNNLGAVYLRQSKLLEARREFEEALRIESGFSEARGNLERVRALLGEAE